MSYANLKVLYEERAEVGKEVRRSAELANDKAHQWTADNQKKWEEVNADYDAYSKKISMLERTLEIEKLESALEPSSPGQNHSTEITGRYGDPEEITHRDRQLSLQGWMMTQCEVETRDEHRIAAKKLGKDLRAKYYDVALHQGDYQEVRNAYRNHQNGEYRANMATTAAVGGETIPEGFIRRWEFALLAFGGMREVAEVIRTPTGNDLPWPTTDDTANEGVLLAENAEETNVVEVATGATTLQAFKYSSKLIKISSELIQDSAFNMVGELGRLLGERIARITHRQFTTGTGSAQPNGIVTASSAFTFSDSNSLAATDVLNLVHDVDPAYRANATFMMHDKIVLEVRKLQDANNNFIWQPGLQLGVPDRLLGYRNVVNQHMVSTVAISNDVMLFGDLSKYKIRDVATVRLRRLVERYAEFDQEGFIAFSRHDGDLLDAGTNPVKRGRMAAS